MARYEHLPIYKAALDVAVGFEKLVAGFSRYHKYPLGTELGNGSRRVVEQIVRANAARERLPELLALHECLGSLLRCANARPAQKAVWLAGGGLTLAVAASVLVAADFGPLTRRQAFEDLEPASGAHSGCRTEVSGKEVFLRPGESVPAARGWKSCQVYDGHLLITYAGLPATSKQAD